MQDKKGAAAPAGQGEDPACGECHGEGVIVFNPSLRGDPQCEDEARCDHCHGTGVEP